MQYRALACWHQYGASVNPVFTTVAHITLWPSVTGVTRRRMVFRNEAEEPDTESFCSCHVDDWVLSSNENAPLMSFSDVRV